MGCVGRRQIRPRKRRARVGLPALRQRRRVLVPSGFARERPALLYAWGLHSHRPFIFLTDIARRPFVHGSRWSLKCLSLRFRLTLSLSPRLTTLPKRCFSILARRSAAYAEEMVRTFFVLDKVVC